MAAANPPSSTGQDEAQLHAITSTPQPSDIVVPELPPPGYVLGSLSQISEDLIPDSQLNGEQESLTLPDAATTDYPMNLLSQNSTFSPPPAGQLEHLPWGPDPAASQAGLNPATQPHFTGQLHPKPPSVASTSTQTDTPNMDDAIMRVCAANEAGREKGHAIFTELMEESKKATEAVKDEKELSRIFSQFADQFATRMADLSGAAAESMRAAMGMRGDW